MICEKRDTGEDDDWSAFDVEPRYYSKHAQCGTWGYQKYSTHETMRLKMNGKEYITHATAALAKGAYPDSSNI